MQQERFRARHKVRTSTPNKGVQMSTSTIHKPEFDLALAVLDDPTALRQVADSIIEQYWSRGEARVFLLCPKDGGTMAAIEMPDASRSEIKSVLRSVMEAWEPPVVA